MKTSIGQLEELQGKASPTEWVMSELEGRGWRTHKGMESFGEAQYDFFFFFDASVEPRESFETLRKRCNL